jgi:uncharacterized membrane protein (DUF2068 family)
VKSHLSSTIIEGDRVDAPIIKRMKTAPSKTIYLIAAFKLFKAVILTITGLAAIRLIHQDVATELTGWARHLHVDPDNHHIHRLFEKVFQTSPKQLKEIAAGTFFYAVLCLTEGAGLLLRQRWAEFLTVIMTALFIPLEVYELIERVTLMKVAVMIINVGIVWYLVARLRKTLASK